MFQHFNCVVAKLKVKFKVILRKDEMEYSIKQILNDFDSLLINSKPKNK